MKKIFIISQVKNEDDIIESFCRYNLTYSDGMLIRDNGSSDNTKIIIQNLIDEGLPIYWADDIFTKYPGMRNKDAYAKKAIDEYGADLIIPLDADEFLYHTDGINPCETLESLHEDVEYQALWRTYVYEHEPDIKLGFMPNNFTQYRNPRLEQFHINRKVVASRHLIKDKQATFVPGAHSLFYPEEYHDCVKIEILEKLVFAHFPLRSKAQVIKKVIPNWIYKWITHNRVPREYFDARQMGKLFNHIKKYGDISMSDMKYHSIEYAVVASQENNFSAEDLEKIKKDLGSELTIEDPMNVTFCKNKLKLRYTNYKENNKVFLQATLTEIDKAVSFLSNESDEKSKLINEIQKKYEPTSTSYIFLDTGKGHNLNEVLTVPLFRHENYFEAKVTLPPNVRNIRFDPVKNFACIIDNMQITTNVGKIEYTPINGFYMDGMIIFDNNDPQIFIDFKGRNISYLQITGYMRHFIIDDISFLSTIKQVFEKYFETKSEVEILNIEKNNLTIERNNLATERDGLVAERDRLVAERDGLLNSRSWRFTKPLRSFGVFVRRHKVLQIFAKCLLSLKRNGIIGTVKKIVTYIAKLRNSSHTVNPDSPIKISDNNFITPIRLPTIASRHVKNVDIIICIHNALEDVKRCIESVFEYTSEPFNIILVDDGSEKPTKEYLESLANDCPNINLIRNEKAGGYTRAANKGLKRSKAEYCVLLNSDTIVTNGWLDKMIQCKKSDDKIGIVGPLSNTASWQSVPEIEKNGDWAHNNLPDGIDLERFGEMIEMNSGQIYPRLPLLNGFCIMLHRNVIKKLGYLDEKRFGSGFAEEDDYNLRAGKKGIQLAIADDTFIFHAQSKSYTNEKRLELSRQNGEKLRKKHGDHLVNCCVHNARDNFILEGIRARVQILGERERLVNKAKELWEGKRILFLLPLADMGGGGNVVIQESNIMMTMGIDVWIYNLLDFKNSFEASHSTSIPIIYGNSFDDAKRIASNFDVVCATANTTVEYCNFEGSKIHRVYYIQDYEPYFYEKDSTGFHRALRSYTLLPNMILVTKSEWNRKVVERETKAKATIIGKSVDIDLFRPRKMFPNKSCTVISAMIRPHSPRRSPELTLNILNEIAARYGDRVSIYVFGSDPNQSDLDKTFWDSNYKNPKIKNLGKLGKRNMASLLSITDIFADFSLFQAMGLTAMEAMACGCCVVAPRNGGCVEFINDNENGFLVDTNDKDDCTSTLCRIIDDYELLCKISYRAIRDICAFYPEKCVYNFLEACFIQEGA